jgi:hypothetical protein
MSDSFLHCPEEVLLAVLRVLSCLGPLCMGPVPVCHTAAGYGMTWPVRRHLVKWKGYDNLYNTWEPEDKGGFTQIPV